MVATAQTLQGKSDRLQAIAEPYPADRARALAEALGRRIAGEVRFDDGSRALYATDGSNYRQVPIGVVMPKTLEDVVATVRLCREHGAPVLSRGGGTSLSGQCCNVAVVMDFSKYLHEVIAIDSAARSALVQPGVILDHLRRQAERFQLTFGPDPATHDHNSLGGMIGNNSCGPHSVMAGRTADNVEALEILTYDGERMWVGETGAEELERIIAAGGRRGEIYRRLKALRDEYAEDIRRGFPDIPRRVSGYNLPQLLPENGFNVARALVGTEGTCVTILQARLRLVHSPSQRVVVVLGFDDVYQAGDAVPRVLEHQPIALEGLDQLLIEYLEKKQMLTENLALLPKGQGFLITEIGTDDHDESLARARRLIQAMDGTPGFRGAALLAEQARQEEIWKIRESGLAATAHVPGQADTWPGWEDSAVPPERVGDYLRDFRRTLEKYGYACSLYGHFGDGCIHTRIDFDLSHEDGIQKYRRFVGEMAELVNRYGGSYSGEHGDGQARAELLPKMYGKRLYRAMREFKAIWDPQGKMNPGKVMDPYPITANLRLGTEFRPKPRRTWYSYAEDAGSFTNATIRCVGVGKCRHHESGVMCPSYMATWEEKHSTRGRARLLFEMVHGGALKDGWKSDAVHEALDLCLACKGCKRDCPVSVDMATYKSEFMAHYYRGRLRPPHHLALGLIYWWSRLAAKRPGLANLVTRGPGISRISKRLAGIARQRQLPPFAEHSFRDWFAAREGLRAERQVMLYPDTFNSHFRPEVAKAAVEVLEYAGYQVLIPERSLCCARPMYDIGMLGGAKRLLEQNMDTLDEWVDRGIPVVGLEPACVASFRDELPNLFPNDGRARKLAGNTQLLTEFLAGLPDLELPEYRRKALVHFHCHHHAVLRRKPEQDLLARMKLDARILDSGCCGMAGAFGFEEDHYQVSMAAAERVLLPAVREAPEGAMVITNGFSCAEQVLQGTGIRPLHMAEVLREAIFNQGATH